MKRYQKPVAEIIELLIDDEIMDDTAGSHGSMGDDKGDIPWQ